jgi:preprotein translocase subunit SecF
MDFIKHRKIFYIVSGVFIVISIVAFFVPGLNLGVDFTGGTLWEIEFKSEQPALGDIRSFFDEAGFEALVQNTEGSRVLIRMADIDEATHQQLSGALEEKFNQEVEELRFDSIGPIIGEELKRKAVIATTLAIIAILIYIALAFRKMTRPVSSFKFGISAILTLAHDVIITVGIFVLLGAMFEIEVGLPFVAAILTVLGYSVNDTVVVFDRVRENSLRGSVGKDFKTIINSSLMQTLSRSLITSLTVIFALLAIFLFGGMTIRYFALAILIGIVLGTYSSIFIASPLLFDFGKKIKKG